MGYAIYYGRYLHIVFWQPVLLHDVINNVVANNNLVFVPASLKDSIKSSYAPEKTKKAKIMDKLIKKIEKKVYLYLSKNLDYLNKTFVAKDNSSIKFVDNGKILITKDKKATFYVVLESDKALSRVKFSLFVL